RTLFREMFDGFALHEIVLDEMGIPADYRFLAVNPAFERMTGLKSVDIIGRTVLTVMPDLEHHWIETYGRVALTGEPIVFDSFSGPLDKYFEVTAFRPAAGRFACIFSDITARRRAEEALRHSEERYRMFIEAAPEAAFVQSEGLFVYLNQAMVRLLGADKPEQLIGREFMEHMAPEYREAIRERIRIQHETGKTAPLMEQEYLLLDGTRVPVETTAVAIQYQGRPAHLVFVRDITERRRADEEREKLQSQLYQSQKLESIGRLAGGVAHDFNNMLGVILGHAELLLSSFDRDHPCYQDLEEIHLAAQRSADLTSQLLAFARKQTVTPRVLDLNATVESMLKMLKRLIGEDIELVWQPGSGHCTVRIDPGQIDQILANLCINARDAISGVGKITIAVSGIMPGQTHLTLPPEIPPGEYAVLSVCDTGSGMDQETLSNLFEPFFTTKEKGKGTGLGMATVYGIVRQNNGFIDVQSLSGSGTTIKIHLPVHASSSAQTSVKAAVEIQPATGSETLLLVEDEPMALNLLVRILKGQGYNVLAASTPGAAISLAREHQGSIQLLVTDVIMPEMNGRDLAKNLLALYPVIRRLFMSGYTAEYIAHHGVLDEGVHFIQKPFTPNSLAAKVREVLDRKL
ncbi:MAG: PAS domain S-box protein, partial [Candidatus Wallbacteria bacterium]|nr:PAS domain S-box protein [Candidatus Wallbacteria bacterium]